MGSGALRVTLPGTGWRGVHRVSEGREVPDSPHTLAPLSSPLRRSALYLSPVCVESSLLCLIHFARTSFSNLNEEDKFVKDISLSSPGRQILFLVFPHHVFRVSSLASVSSLISREKVSVILTLTSNLW